MLAADAPGAKSPRELRCQLSVNVYHSVPDAGGELVLWCERYTGEQLDAWCLPGRDELDPQLMPPPSLLIRPRSGELIAFDTSNVHAVATVMRGERISFASFVGYRGSNDPLEPLELMWL